MPMKRLWLWMRLNWPKMIIVTITIFGHLNRIHSQRRFIGIICWTSGASGY